MAMTILIHEKGGRGGWSLRWLQLILGLALLGGACGCQGGYDYGRSGPGGVFVPRLSSPLLDAGPTQVYVHPTRSYRRSPLALAPVRVPLYVPDLSEPLTQILLRKLLERQPFLGVTRLPRAPESLEDARRQARSLGAHLVLLAEAPYYLDSGTTGKSGLQLDVKIWEVESGRLAWHLSNGVSTAPRPMIDLWVTETRPYPPPSTTFLAELLADRLCGALLQDPVLLGEASLTCPPAP